jgi:hypothetical protein
VPSRFLADDAAVGLFCKPPRFFLIITKNLDDVDAVAVVYAHPCATVESLTQMYILVPEESGEVKTNTYYEGG